MSTTLQHSAFLEAIQNHDSHSTAIVHSQSNAIYTYSSLFQDVARAKTRLTSITGSNGIPVAGERVAFMVENGYSYVVTLLAILAADAIAVPLATSFPATEIRHIINDSDAFCLLWSAKYAERIQEVLVEGVQSLKSTCQVDELFDPARNVVQVNLTGSSSSAQGGMMLYTSGTTARPKGVMLSTSTLEAQSQSLLKAWEYTLHDHLLHVLPLHHIHGTVNAVLAPLLAGSSIEFLYPFNAQAVWSRFAAPFQHATSNGTSPGLTNGHSSPEFHSIKTPITFFTAVPTIWARMLQTHSTLDPDLQTAGLEAIKRKNLRLNISGSAALPKPVRDGWSLLSGGNNLLERYGMTEVGMALSCGLDDSDRVAESVGWPLPSVQVRLLEVDEDNHTSTIIAVGEEFDLATGKERQGEIQLRGPTIFTGYWRNPAATKKEFTDDGWFKTGDIAIRRSLPGSGSGSSGEWAQGPAYFIQGRQSADIIKTGGEKVSALEIERELLSLPQIDECAVVGLPSDSWGQKVAAVIVLSEEGKSSDKPWGLVDMKSALRERLVPYKIPKDIEIVSTIKRNAMGKVNKKELMPAVFGDGEKIRRRSFDLRERAVVTNKA